MEYQDSQRNRIARIVLTVAVLASFALMFLPFFTPLLFAALFAFALEGIVTKYAHRFKNRKIATGLMITLLFIFVAGPIVLISLKSISTLKDYLSVGLQNTSTYKSTEQLFTTLTEKANEIAKTFDLDLSQIAPIGDLLNQSSQFAAGFLTKFISSIPEKALSLFVFLMGFYYFMVQAPQIKKLFLKFNFLTRTELEEIIKIIKKSSYLTLVASALVGSIQALIIASFGYFSGYTEFMILFVLTFMFSLIPLIGAGPIAFFLSVLSFAQGHTGQGVAMLIGAVIAGTIDNILKPLIVSSTSDELHPIISLLALIGALLIYGIPGILLGPILTQLAFKITSILYPVDEAEIRTVANE